MGQLVKPSEGRSLVTLAALGVVLVAFVAWMTGDLSGASRTVMLLLALSIASVGSYVVWHVRPDLHAEILLLVSGALVMAAAAGFSSLHSLVSLGLALVLVSIGTWRLVRAVVSANSST